MINILLVVNCQCLSSVVVLTDAT